MEKLLGCALPLLFDSGCAKYSYGIAGTGFAVSFEKRVWLISAKHCILSDINTLFYPINSKEYFTYDLHVSGISDNDDTENADYVLLRVSSDNSIPDCLNSFVLNDETYTSPDDNRIHGFILRGFPSCLANEICYDEKIIRYQHLDIEFKYEGKTNLIDFYTLKCNIKNSYNNYDKLSGHYRRK